MIKPYICLRFLSLRAVCFRSMIHTMHNYLMSLLVERIFPINLICDFDPLRVIQAANSSSDLLFDFLSISLLQRAAVKEILEITPYKFIYFDASSLFDSSSAVSL